MYNKENENVVLCASNSYEKKYYFNPDFDKLPEDLAKLMEDIRLGRKSL